MAIVYEAKIRQIHRTSDISVVVRLNRTDGPYTGTDGKESFEYYKRTPIGDGEYTLTFDGDTGRLAVIAAVLAKMADENTRLNLGFKLSDRLCAISSI